MIVFDASGSMAGNVSQGIATIKPRIDEARHALATVLPRVTRYRRVGLVTYGPGAYNQCNVQLKFEPTPNAAERIMREAGSYYVIRVADPPVGRKANLRELDVRVLRRGVTVRARRAIPGAR